MKTCRHGHPWDETNTYWYLASDGYMHRQCKTCKQRVTRLHYRNNDAYRERTKQKARARYYAAKAEPQFHCDATV